MEAHQIRVVEEKKELDEKLQKLGDFCNTPIFNGLPDAEIQRLNRQYMIMELYSQVLGERIEAFAV